MQIYVDADACPVVKIVEQLAELSDGTLWEVHTAL